MEYLLMLYVNENGWSKLTDEQKQQGTAAYTAYAEALTKAGALRGGQRLKGSSSATTVRLANGKPQVLDGPYAELEGTGRRLLHHRRAGPGFGDLLGGTLPDSESRRRRAAPLLADVDVSGRGARVYEPSRRRRAGS